jgi:uncharacterized membrane protein YkvA (DUF1232 family)
MFRRLKTLAASVRSELGVYRRVLRHPRTPRLAKWLLGLAIGYLLMPIDLIPDWIPVVGQVDDLIIVPGLVILALRLVPRDVIAECRRDAAQPPQGS